MLGRVYTFERVTRASPAVVEQPASHAAIEAIRAAIDKQPGIRYEELTDAGNPRPVIAVLFERANQMAPFNRRIETALERCGMTVHLMRAPASRARARSLGATNRPAWAA